jgi:hypothetical protein
MLEISFLDGTEESFGFQMNEKEAKKEIFRWIKAINKAITGNIIEPDSEQYGDKNADQDSEEDEDEDEDEDTDDSVLGAFRDIGNELKEAFIGPQKTARQKQSAALALEKQIETLKKLKELQDAGILSRKEFEAKKKEVMKQ